MPPVFGPVSPSPTRLKSCAGASGTAASVSPLQSTSNDSSGPRSPSSMTTRAPGCRRTPPPRGSSARRPRPRGATRSRGRPSPPRARRSSRRRARRGCARNASAASSSPAPNDACIAVGTPAPSSSSFIQRFEPSRRAPASVGPKARRPRAVTASTTPHTSGSSGPTTTRSASTSSASDATASPVLGLHGEAPRDVLDPGVARRGEDLVDRLARASPHASACSRPPPPITSDAHAPPTRQPGARRSARGGTDPQERDRHARVRRDELDEVASLDREVVDPRGTRRSRDASPAGSRRRAGPCAAPTGGTARARSGCRRHPRRRRTP